MHQRFNPDLDPYQCSKIIDNMQLSKDNNITRCHHTCWYNDIVHVTYTVDFQYWQCISEHAYKI